MENTLDSIRPSETGTEQADMSYLYGRDPSILAYGQRPLPSSESKRNLYSLYEEEPSDSTIGSASATSLSSSAHTVKVYLRMKPFPRRMKLSKPEEEAYKIINSTTLLTKLPSLNNNISAIRRTTGSTTVCRRFTFNHTFGPDTTQLQLFELAIKQQMVDFLCGRNSTVMSYGTTNAGKSYTLQGTTTSPGIIPRGLEFVFSNIDPRPTPCYKPTYHCSVKSLNADERAFEMETKTKLLTFGSVDKIQYINAYTQMQKLLQDESPMKPSSNNDASYSVWVSFAEIYNETIYDLLFNDCQKKRPALKLATDNDGRPFIKGLKTVCVNSGSEAYQVLMLGQYNLKVAATALNARSSRSHCIFTIKLLKYYKENTPEEVEVSTFSFCDLAGSERLKKTLNVGERLKEAQNINTSLLVLGRCLKSIWEGQTAKQKQEVVGPFRESKLTRLFQRALSGREYIALIVNVNPVPNLYVETQNVLNFSAIAKKIVMEVDEVKKRKSISRFSQVVTQSIKTVTDWESSSIVEDSTMASPEKSDYTDQDDYTELETENANLRKEIAALKRSALSRDLQIRQEMANHYTIMMKDLEATWKSRVKDAEEQQEDQLTWSVKQLEIFYEDKLSRMNRKRRRTDDDDDSQNEEPDVDELRMENNRLTERIISMKDTIKSLKENTKTLQLEKNKSEFEIPMVKEELKNMKKLLAVAENDLSCDGEATNYIRELEDQLAVKDIKNKNLKKFLDEAKDEFIEITSHGRKMELELEEQRAMLLESDEKISDLEEQLEHLNVCLAEKTSEVEDMEEKLEVQGKALIAAEIKTESAQNELAQFESKNLILLEEVERLRKMVIETQEKSLINTQNRSDNNAEEPNSDNEKTHVKELTQELEEANQTIATLKKTADDKDQKLTEYANSLELMEKKLMKVTAEKVELEEESAAANVNRKDLEMKLSDCEPEIKELNDRLTQSRHKEEHTLECLTETESKLKLLEKEHRAAIERDDIKTQCLDAHRERISKLEQDLAAATELQQQVTKLDIALDKCRKGKDDLQRQLDQNIEAMSLLENKLQAANDKEQEKDYEITSLQREIKNMIHQNANGGESEKEMEKVMKETLKELNATKEALTDKEQQYEELEKTSKLEKETLEKSLKKYKDDASNIALLQQGAESRQAENERLREINTELKRKLSDQDHEMEAFSRNRDEMITRYEALLKSTQEELEMNKREVARFQEVFMRQATPTHSKEEIKKLKDDLRLKEDRLEKAENELKKLKRSKTNKESYANTSDDEVAVSESRSTRRKGRREAAKPISESNQDDIAIIELSGSESKRTTRRTALPPPEPPSGEKKRTRKKKLFVQTDEDCVDLEPCESVPPPFPPSATRNLRARRK